MSDPFDSLDLIDEAVRTNLGALPLDADASRRIRVRLGVAVDARRLQLLEGALHGGFAVAAVAWTLLIVVR